MLRLSGFSGAEDALLDQFFIMQLGDPQVGVIHLVLGLSALGKGNVDARVVGIVGDNQGGSVLAG
jgi:hypothetical protein